MFKEWLHFNEESSVKDPLMALDMLSQLSGEDLSQYKNTTINTEQFNRLKKIYRQLAMRYHPDRNHGDSEAREKFHDVSKSYEEINKAFNAGRPLSSGTQAPERQNGYTNEDLLDALQQVLQNGYVTFSNVETKNNIFSGEVTRENNKKMFSTLPHDPNYYNIIFQVNITIDDNEGRIKVYMVNRTNYGDKVINSKEYRMEIYDGFGRTGAFRGYDEHIYELIKNMIEKVHVSTKGILNLAKEFFQELHIPITHISGTNDSFIITIDYPAKLVHKDREWAQAASSNMKREWLATKNYQLRQQIDSADAIIYTQDLFSTATKLIIKLKDKELELSGLYVKYKHNTKLHDSVSNALKIIMIHAPETALVNNVYQAANTPNNMQSLAKYMLKINYWRTHDFVK
jgi:hypothetical protein